MRLWDTPVPISNTQVKPQTADGTWWETAWESRRLPVFKTIQTTWNQSKDSTKMKASSTIGSIFNSKNQLHLENCTLKN